MTNLDQDMVHNPHKWRRSIMPLVVGAGERRTAVHRDILAHDGHADGGRLRDDSALPDTLVEDELVLTKRRFKRFRSLWDGYASDEASVEFDSTLAEQRGKHSLPNEDRIAVADIPRLRKAKKRESGSSLSPSCKRVGDDLRHGRVLANSRRGCSATESSSVRSLRERTPTLDRSPARTHATRGRVALTADTLRRMSQRSRSRGSRSPSAGRKSMYDSAASRFGDGSKITLVKVVTMKAELKRKAAQMVTDVRAGRCAFKKLQVMVAKMTPEQRIELGEDPQPPLDVVEAQLKELTSLGTDVETAKAHQMDHFSQRLDTASRKVQEHLQSCEAMLEAASFVMDSEKAASRKEANAQRYLRRKVCSRLVSGGYGANLAKTLVTLWDGELDATSSPRKNPVEFQADAVTVWTVGKDDVGAKLLRASEDEYTPAATDVRKESLVKYLKEHPKSGGSMGAVERSGERVVSPIEFDIHEQMELHAGCAAWLVCNKAYRLRYGPSALPLTGMPCLLRLVAGNSMTVAALPAAELLSQGISMPDMLAFLETKSGAKLLTEKGKFVDMQKTRSSTCPSGGQRGR